MSLTKSDLKQIDEMIERKLEMAFNAFFNRLLPILSTFVTKDEFNEKFDRVDSRLNKLEEDLNELKDGFVRLEDKLDKGYSLLKLQVDQNTSKIKKHEHVISQH